MPTLRVGSSRVGSSFAYKYKTRVEVSDSDKHYSLLQYGINYGRKMLFTSEVKSLP